MPAELCLRKCLPLAGNGEPNRKGAAATGATGDQTTGRAEVLRQHPGTDVRLGDLRTEVMA